MSSATGSGDAAGQGPSDSRPGMILALALFLMAAVIAFALLPREDAAHLVFVLLASLALVGIVALFGYAIGFLKLTRETYRDDITRIIADSSTVGVLVVSSDSRIVYANEAYRAFAASAGQGDLRTVERLFAGGPEISGAVYRLAQAARDGRAAVEEFRVAPPLRGDATHGWYRVNVRPVAYRAMPGTCLWTVADISAEREGQEKIFAGLQQAVDFLDHAPAGFLSCNGAGFISYMNATLSHWLDHDLAEVGSGGLHLKNIVAGDGAALLAAMGGDPGETRTEQFEVDLKRRNGQSLPVRLLHRVTFAQDRTPGDSRTLVLSRAHGGENPEEQQAAEVRFARVFHSTPMAIAIVDKDGKIGRSNASFARLLPYALKNTAGEPVQSVLAGVIEQDRPSLADAIKSAATGHSDIAPVNSALEGPGQRSARIFVSPSDEQTDNQTAGGAILFALETTEQRNLQESFAQSQKMQAVGQLAGGIAHDFNNVLTAIIGYSDLLLAHHRPTDPSFQDIMQIRHNANRAAGLVRQLLAFSRRQTMRPQVLQLGEVLSDIQMMLRRLVGETIEFDMKHGRDLWLVMADANQFEQVIVNLVVNARDAMQGGGRITLRTRNVTAAECADFHERVLVAADYVAIEVEDNGVGIPADIRAKIFEPFFTTKDVGKGTGLGLSMVYGIVKQTEGYVFCESEVGKGTTFRVLLPRYIPTASDIEEQANKDKPQAMQPAADLTGRGTILLVEDEEAVRAFGARALTSRGYTVLQAASGLEALDVVAQANGKIDLIVSDVVMPEMDGPTMFGELRKRGITAKVIFVSGYAEEAFSKNLPEGEKFGFLPKPFSLKELIETVKANVG